jgi:hypothetical protein
MRSSTIALTVLSHAVTLIGTTIEAQVGISPMSWPND